MNHIFELSHSTLARIPFFKILLFVFLLGAAEVNAQNIYFGDNGVQMSSTDGVNFDLTNFEVVSSYTSCYFYSESGFFYGCPTIPNGVSDETWYPNYLNPGVYNISINIITRIYSFVAPDCSEIGSSLVLEQEFQFWDECSDVPLKVVPSPFSQNWTYQWFKNGQGIVGANSESFIISANANNPDVYYCLATCNSNQQTINSNSYTKIVCSNIEYMLLQNVTVTGINSSQGTAQVQFDINWGNSWKDSINWDAAWVFMKYKNTAGEWKHAKINATGYDHGQGTNNIIQPTADKMGAFVRMAEFGQTNFSVEGMQLQWNYSIDGLSNASDVEVKLFATEMVYIPEGDFTTAYTSIYPPAGEFAVINNRMSPVLSQSGFQFRVKGSAGLDSDSDGIVDSPNFPTGYHSFYVSKTEMTQQQYADFLNCLGVSQQSTLKGAGNSISEVNGVFYASSPSAICGEGTPQRVLSFADWSGMRPLSSFELAKAINGPYSYRDYNFFDSDYGNFWMGGGYFGFWNLTGNYYDEPAVAVSNVSFNKNIHGNGLVDNSGFTDESSWLDIIFPTQGCFRFARTAE
jgi:hypothetical protein